MTARLTVVAIGASRPPGCAPSSARSSANAARSSIPEAGDSNGKALGKLVNYVDVGVLGGLLRARCVAQGDFEQLEADEIATLAARNGTALTDQTVRVTFAPPRVTIAGLCFELSGAAAQPPVELCTTYLDENVRLGLVTSGGRFVFGRGGKAAEEWADDWQAVVSRQPTPEWVPRPRHLVCIVPGAPPDAAGAGGLRGARAGHRLLRHQVQKFAASGGLRERMATVLEAAKPRERMRALVLRIDPSLAEREGEELRLGDLPGARACPGSADRQLRPVAGREGRCAAGDGLLRNGTQKKCCSSSILGRLNCTWHMWGRRKFSQKRLGVNAPHVRVHACFWTR